MTKKIKSFNFLLAALFAVAMAIPSATLHAQATAPAAAQPAAPAAPAVTNRAATDLAKKIYLQLSSGTIDRSLLTPEMSKALTPETIATLVPQLKAFGDLVSFTLIGGTRINAGINYKFAIKFPNQQHQVAMYLDPHGLVGGYFIRP